MLNSCRCNSPRVLSGLGLFCCYSLYENDQIKCESSAKSTMWATMRGYHERLVEPEDGGRYVESMPWEKKKYVQSAFKKPALGQEEW